MESRTGMERHDAKAGLRAFALVEQLVTLGILSVGVLGVTALHAAVTRQGAGNKARVEALALAQARIEELRGQAAALATPAAFATAFADTGGFSARTGLDGTNASFTREEAFSVAGKLKRATVRVSWSDPGGDSQSLSLDTHLAYVAPRSIGAAALAASAALVTLSAGNARLGTGMLPEHALTLPNDDGTALYEDGRDLVLVAAGRAVLTLADACASTGEGCVAFARIKGRVWIDRATQGSVKPGAVFVVASGAAFCARHYTVNGFTVPVTPLTTATVTTPGGDYEWFDYTCYVGGGWHGSVGLLPASGLHAGDKVCIGDPATTDAAAAPVLAPRRRYHGLLYKHDAGTASGREETTTAQGPVVRYYRHGIAAGTELPAPAPDAPSHDFVFGAFAAERTDDASCVTEGLMTRPDAGVGGSESLFAGMPGGFVCLNDHLDSYDAALYGHDASCPPALPE